MALNRQPVSYLSSADGKLHDPYGNITNATAAPVLAATPVAKIIVTSIKQLVAAFSASASLPSTGATITGYAWNAGDGTTGTGVTFNHTYAKGGIYVVTLSVTDSTGQVSVVTRSIQVTAAVGPSFTATAISGSIRGVSFDASSTILPSGVTATYAWDFGDGGAASGTTATHTYASNGVYTVKLTETNSLGVVTSTSKAITMSNQLPTAAFSFTQGAAAGGAWNRVDVDASASFDPDGTIVAYDWDFGQSTFHTTNPVANGYIYSNAGTYTIKLTVTDNDGGTATTSHPITLVAPVTTASLGDGGGLGVQQSGSGIVAYNAGLSGDFSTKVNAVGSSLCSLPSGTFTFNDFAYAPGWGTPPTEFFFGAWIKSRGILGAGSKYTTVEMTPSTSTKASDVPTQGSGQSNQLQYIFIGTADAVVDGVLILGTEQGHLYNGLRFDHVLNPTLSNSTIRHIPGNYGSPPGETFGCNFQGCTGTVTVKNVTADGQGVGASIMGSNNSSATYNITNLLSQNNPYGSGWASWEHSGVMNFHNYVSRANAKAFNAERLSGTVNFYDPLWDLPGGGGGNGPYDINPSYDSGWVGGTINFYFTTADNWNAFTAGRGGAGIKAITDQNSVNYGLKRSTVINVYVGGVKQTQANYVTWSGAGAGT